MGHSKKKNKDNITEIIDELDNKIYDNVFDVIRCPNCDRIWVADKVGDGYKRFKSYAPE